MATEYVTSGYWADFYTGDDIYIDPDTYEIIIPRDVMTLLQSDPIEVRQLDLGDFHDRLRDLEDDARHIIHFTTHNYSAALDISGVILAQVVEILEPYTITFEDGQYAVNVTNGNSNVSDKVNINNVGIRTANSAGLQDLSSLQAASFSNDSVALDITSTYNGTTFPIGTRRYPVNNITDAKNIADERGMSSIIVIESMTLSSGDFSDGYTFYGDNPLRVVLDIETAPIISNVTFINTTLQGTLDGNNVVRECNILDLNYVAGFIFQSALGGTITLAPGSQMSLLNCYSNVAGGGTPIIDFDSSTTTDLAVRAYSGGMRIKNLVSTDNNVSIDIESGRLFIDSTCTAGNIIVRGVAEVIDESGGAVTIVDETLNSQLEIINTGIQKSSLVVPHSTNLP